MGDAEDTVRFTIELDPRITASDADTATWVSRLAEMQDLLSRSLHGLEDLRDSRTQIEALMSNYADDSALQEMGNAANAAIGAWEENITQLKHQTYEDEDAWKTMLAGQLRYLLDVIDRSGPPVTDGAMTRMRDLKAEWQTREAEMRAIADSHIRPINEWAQAHQVDHISVPK